MVLTWGLVQTMRTRGRYKPRGTDEGSGTQAAVLKGEGAVQDGKGEQRAVDLLRLYHAKADCLPEDMQ